MVEAIRQGDIPGVQIRRRRFLENTTAETLWSWLTQPERLSQWLAHTAEVDASEKGGLRLTTASGETEQAETLDLLPPRLWSLAFRRPDWPANTRLTFEIRPASDEESTGAEMSILQEGFQQLPLSDCLTIWEAYRHRWSDALDRLASKIAG